VPQNVLLNVRTRSAVNGVLSAWGPACRFKIDVTAANCPAANLISTPGPTLSCGATGKIVKASGYAGRIYAQPAVRVVNGANQSAVLYAWEITEPNTGYYRLIWSNSYTLVLGQWVTNPLLCGTHTYNVRVQASFDNLTWCPWGATCTVGITNNLPAPYCTPVGPMAGPDDRVFRDGDEETSTGTLALWPNPNRGDQLFLSVDQLDMALTTAAVDVFDLFGKKVASYTVPVRDGVLNTSLDLRGGIATGMYLVTVTAGDQLFQQRLVID
jgi:hypothetical protein